MPRERSELGARASSGPGAATIADVARHAGVAKSTVSNFLNGHVRVAEATGRRVADAVVALDYRPAEIARSLNARRRASGDVAGSGGTGPRLTTVGHVSVDYISQLDRLPKSNDRVMASKIFKAVGGPAANVAAIAAGIGGDCAVTCSLLTAVGNDVDSDWAIAELASRRVRILTAPARRKGRLARALVMVTGDGRRSIVAEPISVGEVDLERFIEQADTAGLTWCLHLEGFQVPSQIPQVRAARAAGFRTSMHTTGLSAEWLEGHAEEMFAEFDLLVLQPETLGLIPGCPFDAEGAITWLTARAGAEGPRPMAVIVSLGRDGAVLIDADGLVTRCSGAPEAPLDETGAPDALVGTVLALWLNDVTPAEALPFACIAAGLVASRLGAQEMRPTIEDLVARAGMRPRRTVSVSSTEE